MHESLRWKVHISSSTITFSFQIVANHPFVKELDLQNLYNLNFLFIVELFVFKESSTTINDNIMKINLTLKLILQTISDLIYQLFMAVRSFQFYSITIFLTKWGHSLRGCIVQLWGCNRGERSQYANSTTKTKLLQKNLNIAFQFRHFDKSNGTLH